MSFLSEGVAIVTGAGSGIGRALAQQLAAAGSALALADVDEAGLLETAQSLRKNSAVVNCEHFERFRNHRPGGTLRLRGEQVRGAGIHGGAAPRTPGQQPHCLLRSSRRHSNADCPPRPHRGRCYGNGTSGEGCPV